MNKIKTVLENREASRFFVLILVLALFLAAAALVTAEWSSTQIETAVLQREQGAAGRILAAHPELRDTEVAAAFSVKADEKETALGAQAFRKEGYQQTTAGVLLNFASSVFRTTAVSFSLVAFITLFFCALFALLLFYRIYSGINRASEITCTFARGNYDIRLPEYRDGALARLSHAVNETAGTVNAGFDKLAREREFLKSLLSDISHQLKTPLAALKMYNEIIAQEELTAPVREFTEKSAAQLERMEWLILGLLKTARVEAGMIEFDMQMNDAAEIARECVQEFSDAARKKGITIRAEGGSAPLCCDSAWLNEAIGNIITNGLEYVSPGGNITVKTEKSLVAVSIRISDTGTGIHPDDLPYIFKRFYRGKHSRGDGSGIGLSLARSLAHQMGGTLTAESSFGSGAVFTFTFPVCVV